MKKLELNETGMSMKSAIYTGILQHCRHQPKRHFFQYRVFMMYIDLTELKEVFGLSRLWSFKGASLAWLRRKDFIGDPNKSIADSVVDRIKQETGQVFEGSIRMLANLRYFGFQMNPIVCYYCFDKKERLQYVVAEVTNTPWREKHAYVLPCALEKSDQKIDFAKRLHVSPFNDMDFNYQWIGNTPDEKLSVRLINWKGSERLFEANLEMSRQEVTANSLRKTIFLYPLMTMKVFASIYWQALKLFFKGVPFVGHPGDNQTRNLINGKLTNGHLYREEVNREELNKGELNNEGNVNQSRLLQVKPAELPIKSD